MRQSSRDGPDRGARETREHSHSEVVLAQAPWPYVSASYCFPETLVQITDALGLTFFFANHWSLWLNNVLSSFQADDRWTFQTLREQSLSIFIISIALISDTDIRLDP